MKHVRKRLTYANAMSSIAVFLVLGGGAAFAALGKNTVGTRQLKRNAVKVGKIGPEAVKAGKLAKNAIATNRLRDNAVTGAKVNEPTLSQVPSAFTAVNANTANTADTANSADDSDKVGGKSLNDIVMWAFVDDNGTLLRSSGGVASARVATGTYNVTFPRAVDSCAYNATNAANDNSNPAPNEIAVAKLGAANLVRVRTAASNGAITDDEFMLIVTC
jgi:hypothetical protein